MDQAGIREAALRTIARGHIGYKELIRQVGATKPELDAVLTGLRKDGLIDSTLMGYRLAPKRVPDAEIDMRDDEPTPPAPPTSTTPAPAVDTIRLAPRCAKCHKPKGDHEMSRRNGKQLPICKACYSAGLREGQLRRKAAAQAQTRKELAQVVKKHTKKPPKGPLQVRSSREIRADINELDVMIEVREDDQASGSVTLTYSEAARLRDWLNAQAIS